MAINQIVPFHSPPFIPPINDKNSPVETQKKVAWDATFRARIKLPLCLPDVLQVLLLDFLGGFELDGTDCVTDRIYLAVVQLPFSKTLDETPEAAPINQIRRLCLNLDIGPSGKSHN